MGVNTKVHEGVIHSLDLDVTMIQLPETLTGEVHYNPGLARDDKGNLWISIRSCIHNPKRYKGYEHPVHYQNYLHVGLLDEKTLKVSQVKEIKPEAKYDGLQWGIEDVRLFWREDGLHGIGVILPITENGPKAQQAEILIDHKKGTYKLVRDYGRPRGGLEKNWMPAETATPLFDFTYSPTEIVRDGVISGEPNDLFIHNGTPLIPYQDGYISLAHVVAGVHRLRTYVTLGIKWSLDGKAQEMSQLFHFNVGWREHLKETIEFASAAVWSTGKEGEEMLVGLGVKDELVGLTRLDVSKLRWRPYEDCTWYGWKYDTPPNRTEIPTSKDRVSHHWSIK